MSTKPNLPSGKGQSNKGELANYAREKFAKPFEEVDGGIEGGFTGTANDIGEKSGFESTTDSYIVKKGMVFGEAAKLNIMPPGMDISDQPYADIREMPFRKVMGLSYPGDGWPDKDLVENTGPQGSLA